MILREKIMLSDLKSTYMDLSHGTTWILENDTTNFIFEVCTTTCIGGMVTIELNPSGADIPTTEENKKEYVKTAIEYCVLCHLTKVLDEHGPKPLIGGIFVINIDKLFKDKPEPSKSVFVSSQFTMKTEKYHCLVVLMGGIKDQSHKTSLNDIHCLRVWLALRPCGWVMMIEPTMGRPTPVGGTLSTGISYVCAPAGPNAIDKGLSRLSKFGGSRGHTQWGLYKSPYGLAIEDATGTPGISILRRVSRPYSPPVTSQDKRR
ncbi:hypothetical protein BS47DRAFT_1357687 [Hydnum rufescens UP504]|uniref:HECT-type E3 ubiquitin transferase n=1 Tax=Hydnum rufescens UP504 TaxID=1448309 RepID=A0A9P6B9V7_9AGAM|nr:hypothetical protein BS47DRAFT_1357687 [Hydnum rufescens UP504]